MLAKHWNITLPPKPSHTCGVWDHRGGVPMASPLAPLVGPLVETQVPCSGHSNCTVILAQCQAVRGKGGLGQYWIEQGGSKFSGGGSIVSHRS